MNHSHIRSIAAHEILDSRGNPTVEAVVQLGSGMRASASVPSGASTGQYEALELRDHDERRYGGKGVLTACRNIQSIIAPTLRDVDVRDLTAIDEAMIALDGTPNKSHLGANATLAVSMACARAGALASGQGLYVFLRHALQFSEERYLLPTPMLNILNGGRHADNGLDFQEYMIVPNAPTFHEKLRIAVEVYQHLGTILHERGFGTLVGDEGGFAPRLQSNTTPFELLTEAVHAAGYTLDHDVKFAIDAASSEFYDAKTQQYTLALDAKKLTSDKLTDLYKLLATSYPLISIEDGLADDDWSGWEHLTATLGEKIMLVGDDLLVTNATRLDTALARHVANAVLIKPNQIGTVTETARTVALAQRHGYTVVVSHRSGETTDAFIADLAVAVNAPYIKTGSVARSERSAKYNRLLAIEDEQE